MAKVIGSLEHVIRRFSAYRCRQADIAALHSMTERELKDIRLSRCDIDFIAHRSH